jgi:hypothetical protein
VGVSYSFKSDKEGRGTAVVAKARYPLATKNQTQPRFEHSARSCPSNTVIRVLLDRGSDCDHIFHEKGTHMHVPNLTRQVPTSSYTLNGNFLRKGRSEVNFKFFEYSNNKEYLATPDIVEYDKKKMTKPVYDLILGCKSMKELGTVLDY